MRTTSLVTISFMVVSKMQLKPLWNIFYLCRSTRRRPCVETAFLCFVCFALFCFSSLKPQFTLWAEALPGPT